MVDIWIPIAKKIPIHFGKHRLQRMIPTAAFFEDPRDIGHVFGGRAARPVQPIVIEGADGETPTIIMATGDTDASELEDIAIAAKEKSRARMKATGMALPFDEFRERTGRPRREDVPQMLAEAIERRIEEQRKNWRTDPRRHMRKQD